MKVTTTPMAGETYSWRIVEYADLHPLVRRSLASIFGCRNPEMLGSHLLSDLCLCEVDEPADLAVALQWAEGHCGARIPAAVWSGPPARILISIRDIGSVAAWYFRAVQRRHQA